MRKILELNENDVKEIVATHYSVPVKNITVSMEDECVGYGTGEHMERVLEVEVVMED